MTYQLVTAINVHQPVEQVEHLDPQDPDVGRLALTRLELHERLAEERGRTQARLGRAHRVTHERLRLEQFVQERKEDAIEDVFDLSVVGLVYRKMRAEQDALQVHQSGMSDLPGGVGRLASERSQER